MYLVPKAGQQVPDPVHGDHLPAQGREVEYSQYWQRRVAEGDVAEGQRPTEGSAPVKSKG